ncbi:50S ribosomal protein L6 [Blattabacterium cuenoti]|uniref:50S ribosomal protein L6 n=1 Tax=Blattabacterium cuenoti TaxID=1653831 RepID=UPI00163BC75E|nr:50S ribosomal protein L6 [Blattabacterium cuenoti]
MSRIGKKLILIPENVKLKIVDNKIFVNGKLGNLVQKISDKIKININNNKLSVSRNKEDKISKSLHGLYNVLIKNMIIGVSIGFKKELELVGIGYKANIKENNILDMNLGFSHNIMLQLPKEILVDIKLYKGKNTIIILKSYDKQLLGIVASKIRSFRAPEPYKGKGVRFIGEEIRRKTGKSV